MRVRAVNSATGAWLFGKGRNDYLVNLKAVEQNIKTRLSSFLGDCFFDQAAGIDWMNLLGGKDKISLELAIRAVILNTTYVTGILQLSLGVTPRRQFQVTYRVQTAYSTSSSTFIFDQLPA